MASKITLVAALLLAIGVTLCSSQFLDPLADILAKARKNAKDFQYSDVDRKLNPEPFKSQLLSALVPNQICDLLFPPLLNEQENAELREELFVDVSIPCKESVNHVYFELEKWCRQGKEPETWILHLVDSWGKIQAGMLSGNLASPGDFHECLQMRGSAELPSGKRDFRGLYCGVYIVPKVTTAPAVKPTVGRLSVAPNELMQYLNRSDGITMFPYLGGCYPSVCTKDEGFQLMTNFFERNLPAATLVNMGCRTDEKDDLTTGAIVMIVVLAIIAACCIAGTLVDLLVLRRRSADAGRPSAPMIALKSFSLYENTIKMLGTNPGKDNLGCLHGLRFFSMAWVVAGHTWFQVRIQFNWNAIDAKTMDRLNWTFTTMLNPTVAVDTFFLMSGLLVAYNLLRELDKTKSLFEFGVIKVPMMYLHRYIRLTPTYAILIGILATIVPYINTAPNWSVMEREARQCQNYWWHNILYFNNLMDYRKLPLGDEINMCYQESWYLANDMQFFILSPLIIYPIWKNKKLGLGLLGLYTILHLAGNFIMYSIEDTTPTVLPFTADPEYAVLFYWRPWTRIGPYLIGIFVGWLLYESKKKDSPYAFEMPKWLVWLGWTIGTGTALAVMFGIREYMHPENHDLIFLSWGGKLYGALHRFAWSVSIGWIIYACVMNRGGIVNKILSWSAFMPLGRLTYCVYISSFHLQLMYHLTLIHPTHFSNYMMMHTFFAHLVFTCIVGFILTITIESPMIGIQKLLF